MKPPMKREDMVHLVIGAALLAVWFATIIALVAALVSAVRGAP